MCLLCDRRLVEEGFSRLLARRLRIRHAEERELPQVVVVRLDAVGGHLSAPVMNGFTSKISTVFPGLFGDANTKKVRKVEARIVTWELEHGGTEVVGHRGSFLVGGRAAGPTQQARRYARE